MKYYIKITDEKPLDSEKALWFELETDDNGKADFFVLDRSEYSALVKKFEDVQDSYETLSANFNSDVIAEITPTIESYIASLPSTVDGAYSLVDSEDSENTYDYSTLSSDLSDIHSTLTRLNSDKVGIGEYWTRYGELRTLIGRKSDGGHTHSTWTSTTIDNERGILYKNEELGIVFFRYYRADVSFSKTTAYTQSFTIPAEYRPIRDTVLSFFNPSIAGLVKGDGSVAFQTDATGTKNVNCTGMWIV